MVPPMHPSGGGMSVDGLEYGSSSSQDFSSPTSFLQEEKKNGCDHRKVLHETRIPYSPSLVDISFHRVVPGLSGSSISQFFSGSMV